MSLLKLAYGTRDDIQTAIDHGVIPPGSLIYTKTNEIFFYDLDCNLRTYKEKNKFDCKADAEEWVDKYHCYGEIVSVHENGTFNAYIVGYDNCLKPVNEVNFVQGDWLTEDPEDPSYIKNKPTLVNDKTYTHVQKSASNIWNINHNLNKMPSVTIVDSAGTVVTGEINYIDMNNLTLKFSGAFSGKAFIN